MKVATILHAAGRSDPGLQRENNEDRFHEDVARGLFMVVDGVGGHAAGDKAAETAIAMLRTRLERETGAVEDRVREAITIANNEVHRLATIKEGWRGMSCVLTVAVVDNSDLVVGHVGDTRLYKIAGDRIEKVTRDHSPVGEREDSGELSERDAMQHPRRNEVYRDVGSQERQALDPDFVDVRRVPFESDAAMLICSDGLTDCVTSLEIMDVVRKHAGRPQEVVRALVQAANDAGGKDNVTVVYAEGPRFVAGSDTGPLVLPRTQTASAAEGPRPLPRPHRLPPLTSGRAGVWPGWRAIALSLLALMTIAAAYLFWSGWRPSAGLALAPASVSTIVVSPGTSIADAIARASAGDTILLEPGEYRERLVITKSIRLASRDPRSSVLRLPAGLTESDAAIVVSSGAVVELSGFRVMGDAATPLGTGIAVTGARVALSDIEIAGAAGAALEFGTGSVASVVGADIHDNPGAAVIVRAGSAPRIVNSRFTRNATSTVAPGLIVVEPGSRLTFVGNVLLGVPAQALRGVNPVGNWFIPDSQRAPSTPRRSPR
jgi:serine/threonine protein phosphatase PrpC